MPADVGPGVRILEQKYDGAMEVELAMGPSKDRANGVNAAVAASCHPIIGRIDGAGVRG